MAPTLISESSHDCWRRLTSTAQTSRPMSAEAMVVAASMGSRHDGTHPWLGRTSSVHSELGTCTIAATLSGGGCGGWALLANSNVEPLGCGANIAYS